MLDTIAHACTMKIDGGHVIRSMCRSCCFQTSSSACWLEILVKRWILSKAPPPPTCKYLQEMWNSVVVTNVTNDKDAKKAVGIFGEAAFLSTSIARIPRRLSGQWPVVIP